VAWTQSDTAVSISADGSIKQWTSSSGQPYSIPNSNESNFQVPPPHTLGLVSLSVSQDGRLALYNSLEGLTSLWDLTNGEIVGKFESYVRSGEDAEPCTLSFINYCFIFWYFLTTIPSMVRLVEPERIDIRLFRSIRKTIYSFHRAWQFWPAPRDNLSRKEQVWDVLLLRVYISFYLYSELKMSLEPGWQTRRALIRDWSNFHH